jgi:hypothetical protein
MTPALVIGHFDVIEQRVLRLRVALKSLALFALPG